MESGSIPWIEKYRPDSFDKIILEDGVRDQIEIFMQNRQGVHLIIAGAPGVGKTTTARNIARRLLGDNLREGYLEMNSAEDRCVKSVSQTIPAFCRRIVNFPSDNPTCKVILLDEADNLTPKCQNDIIKMIKIHGANTMFIFTCNESQKINEDVQSICRIVRFRPLTQAQIIIYLKNICDQENITATRTSLEIICYIAEGDMRKAINSLQKAAYSFDGKIDKKSVLIACNVPDPEDINQVTQKCREGEFEEACSMLEKLIDRGYYYNDVIIGFTHNLTKVIEVEEEIRLALLQTVHHTKINICTGIRTRLQLCAMLARMVRIFNP